MLLQISPIFVVAPKGSSMSRKLQFIFNPSELGAGTRGASLGPEAIRAAARTKGSTLFAEFPIQVVAQHNELLDHKSPFVFAKNIDGLRLVFDSLQEKIHKCIADEALPLLISGDHSAAAAPCPRAHHRGGACAGPPPSGGPRGAGVRSQRRQRW